MSQGLSHKVSAVRCVCIFNKQESMALSKAVAGASFLIAMFTALSAMPQPGIIRERHVIYTPIRSKIIHHYNIKKIPIVIKKHFHYYKPREEIHHHSNVISDENHSNQINEEDANEHYNEFQFHRQGYLPDFKISGMSFQQDNYDNTEEDYEDQEQSQEKEYKDYEYE